MRGLALALLLAVEPTENPLTLRGRVEGASGKHTVRVALWRADGFLDKPVAELKLAGAEAKTFVFHVAPGRWALSSYEDVNDNGVLDQGLFGPKEPHGFFKRFTGWHKPRFEEVAFDVQGDQSGTDIVLE
jgi:uncharacterized protein (DUF2141 family)